MLYFIQLFYSILKAILVVVLEEDYITLEVITVHLHQIKSIACYSDNVNGTSVPGCACVLFLSNGFNASGSMQTFPAHFISIKSLDKVSQGLSNAACLCNNVLRGMKVVKRKKH